MGLPGKALDDGPVDEAADHRYDEEEPGAEPGQVQAADAALLAELLVPGGQPRDPED